MTNREAQIYQWIKEDPMISQEDLAQKAGITRSSVAVHISNLMRKGYILGKGYVIHEPYYITVVGAANVDIGGRPYDKLIGKDSNPGAVNISLGGVGRNIAHNLRLMGCDVKFVSAIGDDIHAGHIVDSCQELGIDISDCFKSQEYPTSTYLYIVGKDGDMQLAISDMEIYKNLTPEFISGKMEAMNHSQAIIVDANIPQETIEYITSNAKVPVFAETVSCKKAERLITSLSRIHTITPNVLEAKVLSGVDIDVNNVETLKKAAGFLLNRGLKRVFITLGEQGVFVASEEGMEMIPCIPGEVVNATGAGDALISGVCLGFTKGLSIKETARLGMAAARITIGAPEAINSSLSLANLEKVSGIYFDNL